MDKYKQSLKNPTLFLDLETGGFNAEDDAICSCSVMLSNGTRAKTWFIKPYNKNYNSKAMEVNGLTKQFLIDNGVNLETFCLDLIDYLENNFSSLNLGLIQLAGHNISFDIGFLHQLFNNENDYAFRIDSLTNSTVPYKFKDLFHYHFKDSMILANMLKDKGLIPLNQSISLKELYIYLFGDDELSKNAHTSLADVKMSIKCYNEMLNR